MSITFTLTEELEKAAWARALAEDKSFKTVLLEAAIRGLGLEVSDFDLSETHLTVV
jgi:hypothetical protein